MIKKVVRNLADLKLLYDTLKPLKMLGCDVETTALELDKMKLLGIGIGTNTKMFYVPWDYPGLKNEDTVKVLNALFKKPIIFHNAKFDMKVLTKFGFKEPNDVHDTLILSWLSDESTNNGLKFLAKTLLNRDDVVEFKTVEKKIKEWEAKRETPDLYEGGENYIDEDLIDEVGHYCMDDVRNTCDLYVLFKKQLVKEGIWDAYIKLEKPMIKVLNKMESAGVKIDKEWLTTKRDLAAQMLVDLEAQMYTLIGKKKEEFNLNSPKQLEVLLFDELKYVPIKKTASGKRSTDNEVLNQLVKVNNLTDNDFVPLFLKYREMDKLHKTYLIGMLEQGGEEGIIHASFLQHGTRTGRLSSRDPNLQNIPARHDEWDIRQAFIPRPGHKFIVADYSQVELRVLAHFSKDENMVQAFNEDFDIHAKTMEVTGITERRIAKAINFGLIYGMGPRSLAHGLGITEKEAEQYIELFFKGYPKVRPFIKSVQRFVKQNWYIPMLTGRRRRFIEEASRNWYSTVERQSINTKIQGSAADIMKIAMLKMDKVLPEFKARQLIQVHDEIIVEAPAEIIDDAAIAVQLTMEQAVELSVPLKVGMQIGDYWVK